MMKCLLVPLDDLPAKYECGEENASDLQVRGEGHRVARHGLELLHWGAGRLGVDPSRVLVHDQTSLYELAKSEKSIYNIYNELELIYLYFPPSFYLTVGSFCPVGFSLL